MKPDLSGKLAVVTGAASGLGQGMALALAQAGADVAVHYNSSADAAKDIVQHIQDLDVRSMAVQADFNSLESVSACFEKITQEFGAVDILINNASLYFQRPLSQTSVDEFQRMLTINLTAVHLSCQCVLQAMKKKGWGRIINLGLSTAEHVQAYREITPHAISKTGVLILTKSLAVENAEFGITINSISPGLIDNGNTDAETLNRHRELVPMQRNGTVDDLIGALYYLLGPSEYVTGANIIVGGGWGI